MKDHPNIKPGLYEIGAIEITSKQQDSIDISTMMVELSIYEDLYSPFIRGEVTIGDGFNILSNLPIREGDSLHIKLGPDSSDPNIADVDPASIDRKFEIVRIKDRKIVKQDVQTYTLEFASAGWSSHVRTRISRAYPNTTYSLAVQDIFDDKFLYGITDDVVDTQNNPKLDVEETEGSFSFVIPRWKPLKVISWLSERSFKGSACNFVFWQDNISYHFRSIESLMKRGVWKQYSIGPQNTKDPLNSRYFNIIDYKFEDTGDILGAARKGMFGNRLLSYDFITKKFSDHFSQGPSSDNYEVKDGDVFDYAEMFDDLTHCDPEGVPLIEEDVSELMSQNPGNTAMTVIPLHESMFSDMKSAKEEKWIRQRISQTASMKYLKVTATAIGNFDITPGKVINFDMRSPEWQDVNDDKKDLKLSGNYMITAIRRKFDKDKHVAIMELTKDCLYSNESDLIWEGR